MNIVHFGAGGHIGQVVAAELLSRGHTVTGVSRSGDVEGVDHSSFVAATGNASDPDVTARLAAEHDVVVSTVGPRIGQENDHAIIVGAAEGLIAGIRRAGGSRRLVVLGGAGSLTTPGGGLVMDDPHFPVEWLDNARAQAAALAYYRTVEDVDWTFISPAAVIEPGERTGSYRIGEEDLLVDDDSRSRISVADYAVAFADEVEKAAHPRQRIGVAY